MNYRHGEVALISIKSLPEELEKSRSKVFAKGSHGHDHTIDKGELYLVNKGNLIGYLVAKNTSLLHKEHSLKVGDAKIKDGIYKLVKQFEYTPEGLKPIID